MTTESKHDKFRRLATRRGQRVLNDLKLISNLSDTRNYSYTDEEVKRLFSAIDDELRIAKLSFRKHRGREIKL